MPKYRAPISASSILRWLQSIKKLEIQTYYVPMHLHGTCRYVRKKQLGRGWQRATKSQITRRNQKGSSCSPSPSEDSEPRSSRRRGRWFLLSSRGSKEVLPEGCWGCRKSTRVKGNIGQIPVKQSSTEGN